MLLKEILSLSSNKRLLSLAGISVVTAIAGMGCSSTDSDASKAEIKSALVHPGQVIDLSYWNITLPQDANNDGKPDQIRPKTFKPILTMTTFMLMTVVKWCLPALT